MATGFRKLLLRPSMEGRALVLALLLAASPPSPAIDGSTVDVPFDPGLERPAIEIPSIDSEDVELGAYAGILSIEDFGSHALYGVRLAYHVTPKLFMEASLGRSLAGLTSYERLSGGARLLTESERRLTVYTLSAAYDLLPGETFVAGLRAFPSAFYLIAGIGSTDFAGNQRFTLGLGTGYQLLARDWLAIHLDMRDLIFDMDLFGENKRTHNIGISGGISVFF